MSNNKINDLLEDLQDTLENSILNKSDGNENKENESVSELFDTLNKNKKIKIPADSYDLNDLNNSFETGYADGNDTELKISKAIPTPSAFDEALKSQNKFKAKSARGSASLSDTKEVPVNQKTSFDEVKTEKPKRSPLESFLTNSEKSEKEDAEDTKETEDIIYDEISLESDGQSSISKIEVEAEIEPEPDYEIQEIGGDNSDMDMELLKAIGIGKPDENSKSAKTVLDKTNGQENKIHKEKPVSTKKTSKPFYKIINKEYVNREQVNEIFSSYQKAYMSEFVKLVLGAVLFLMLFYMEIAPYLNWKLPNVLNINFYNLPYIWIDLQILMLIAALNSKSLILGIKSFILANINVYSMAFFFFALAFIQTMLTLYLRYNNPNMVLYNAIAAYCMVLVSLYNLLDMNAEIISFKTVSAKKPKYALSMSGSSQSNQFNKSYQSAQSVPPPQPYCSVELETELFKDIIPHESVVGGVLKTPFISNFFSRTYKEKNAGGFIKYFIYISLLGALVLFVFSIGFKSGAEKDWYGSLSAVTALLLGSVPLCSFIIEVYPVFRAQKKARAIGSAFIGGKSLEESAETAIISLYDKDIFPAEQIKISGIKVYGNNRIDTVLQNLCVVFDKLNMPPADTFRASTNFDKNFDKNIKFISIDDYGICYLSNNIKLFLGNPEYISNIGLIPSYDQNFDDPFIKSSGSVMFLASETEIIAKVYLKYEITADFHDIIKNIKKLNACLCIRTFDPNIDDALISKLGNIKKYPVRVLKLKDFANVHAAPERVDSPVVSKDSIKSLVNALLIAGKTRTAIKSNTLIQTAAFAMSIALALILGFMGHLGGINSGHLFLLQNLWMLPVVIFVGITA